MDTVTKGDSHLQQPALIWLSSSVSCDKRSQSTQKPCHIWSKTTYRTLSCSAIVTPLIPAMLQGTIKWRQITSQPVYFQQFNLIVTISHVSFVSALLQEKMVVVSKLSLKWSKVIEFCCNGTMTLHESDAYKCNHFPMRALYKMCMISDHTVAFSQHGEESEQTSFY